VIAIGVPNVYGVGYGTVTQVLAGKLVPATLALLLVAKLVATALYVGSGGSGGLFTPAIFLGATAGGLCGSLLDLAFPEFTASSGAYALVTMGAVVAATTHAPISSILIIFEMTQSIAIIPPLMAACVLSTLVARFLQKESIFTLPLVRRGVDLRPDEDPNVLKSLWVRDVLDVSPQTLPASASFERILDLIVESDHTEFFVVDEAGAYVGPIALAEVRRLLHEREHLSSVVVAGDLVAEGRPSVTPEDNLDLAMRIFGREPVEELAVVDAENPARLVGSLHRRDVITALQQETLRRDLAGGLSSAVAAAERVRAVDLGGGYEVRDFQAPHRFVGRSLRELEIRERAGVQVLLLRRRAAGGGDGLLRVPGPEDRIEAGDVLVVAGPSAGLEALERL
jgi:CIC family chloride channel protein